MVEPPVMAKKAKSLREFSALPGAPGALSRRELCCGTAALLCCLPALRAQAEALRHQPLALTEIAPGIHVSQGVHAEVAPDNQGAIANVGFVVGTERVAVIDSGGCLLWGKRLREAVRRVTPLPISHLVQTHMHPDHVFGAAAFLADQPRIIGHRRLPAALASRQAYYTRRLNEILGDLAAGSVIVPPTELVDGETEIDLGGRALRVSAHRTAHTDNDLSLRDLATGTLGAGDLLFMERVPALDGSLIGWLAVLDEMRAKPAARVVPGHGPAASPWPAAVDAQHRYLTLLRDEIRQAIKSGGTMEQAIATVGQSERPRWRLFDDYHARNVTAAFHELEWE
jgi:quinoprotein relay system zinc metallohydrolase 2